MTIHLQQEPRTAGGGIDAAITDVLTLAWRAPFYRRRWGRRPSGAGTEALSRLPVIAVEDWQRAIRRDPAQVLAGMPALWTLVGCAGRDVWTPLAHADLVASSAQAASALRKAGIHDGDRIFSVLPAAPSSWNALPYLILRSDLAVEFLTVSLETLRLKPDLAAFPISRDPTVLLTSRQAMMELVQLIGALPSGARTVFYGDAADPDPGVSLAALPGCLAPGSRPSGTWCFDPFVMLPEIIVEGASSIEGASGAAGALLPVGDAPVGTTGSLVITTFSQAGPLIRVATGIRLQTPSPKTWISTSTSDIRGTQVARRASVTNAS
ncbi:MAG: hypothetical protein ACT4P5_06260 [Armatimonadota bacterium]